MASARQLLDSYGLSNRYGFLPEKPLAAFAQAYYKPWDDVLRDLPRLISSRELRQAVEALPLLSTKQLTSEAEWRRAYVVLAFLTQAIVWSTGDDGPNEHVPPQVAEPFLEVCQELGMQPVVSYAGLCLWNWGPRSGEEKQESGFYSVAQLEALAGFLDSRGEDTFNHVPVVIEAEGGCLVDELLTAVDNAAKGDVALVRDALQRTAKVFERMIKHLPELYKTLDAEMFYHELRPLISGSKGAADKGLPRGFVFQKSDGSEMATQHVGASAGQSSLFQFLDSVLGIEHKAPADGSESLFEEMRRYMPRSHREFLSAVSQLPSLRSFVQSHSSDQELREAFDLAVKQLRSWRANHIAVVSKYIVRPARRDQERVNSNSNGNGSGNDNGDGAADFDSADGNGDGLTGTGGSALIPFLKATRDETSGIDV